MGQKTLTFVRKIPAVSMGLLAATWLVLTWYDSSQSWLFGVPGILIALLVSRLLPSVRPFKLSFTGIAAFLLFFFAESFLGAVDVSLRALHPKLPLSPSLITFHSRLSNEWALILFVNAISLLPGTLSTQINEKRIRVHVMDKTRPIIKILFRLERKVADMFDEAIK